MNAHPLAQNDLLLRFYERREVEQELVPTRVVDRILEEVEYSSVVLAPSRLVAAQFSLHHKAAIAIEHYGVALHTMRPDALSKPDGPLTALYVGQISRRKGLPFLLEAVRGLKLELKLAGPLVAPDLIKKLPDNVRYLGTVPQGQVRSLMSSADVFVLPTIEDACALVTFEAAAAGVPVITTQNNGAVEIMPIGSFTSVEAGNVLALRAAIGEVRREDIALRQARGRAIRQESQVRDWPAYADAVLRRLTGH
ncbi:glycosyltransferase family 4 protein [Blastococcus sp. TF02A-35]|uniref:glycosyltransferase family 4 protein n=1 Tax=Blastococcus sp. TF02A-35 TaxID=2559612 RepID=UPI0014307B96|nr:glycosyltransferase family 4 protein [Blastococcus sp. TF02A_35]